MSTPMTNKHKATKDKTHTNLSKIKLAKLCRWVMTQGFLVTVSELSGDTKHQVTLASKQQKKRSTRTRSRGATFPLPAVLIV